MTSNTSVNKLLEQNKLAAQDYQPAPFFSEFQALGLSMSQSLIITCLDPRISPEKFVNFGPVGPLIIRDICGHVAPALDDIVSLDSLLSLKDIIIIHHTDCAAHIIKDDNVRNYIKKELPAAENVNGMRFGGILE